VRRYFPRGLTAAALAEAPSLNFDRKDRLQARWIRSVCKRDVDVPVHWLPSIQAFVDAGLEGIGWGVNPLPLVQAQLRNGTLVELVPGRTLSVPLFWQHTRLQMPMLARLTRAVGVNGPRRAATSLTASAGTPTLGPKPTISATGPPLAWVPRLAVNLRAPRAFIQHVCGGARVWSAISPLLGTGRLNTCKMRNNVAGGSARIFSIYAG